MSISAETSTGKLKDAVTLIDNCSSCLLNVAQITSSLKSLDNSFLCVATLNNLPAACDNTGRFIYVQSIEAFRYSDGYEWLMNACSVLGNVNTATALWSWGSGSFGRLGDGTTVNRCSPGTIAGGGTNWCQVSGGGSHSLAIKTDGTLWTWGANYQGRLGDGTTVSRRSPGTIAGGGTNWCQVSGGAHVAAIKCDGTLWSWGYNNSGQLGDGTTVSRCSPGTIFGGGTNWCQVSSGSFSTAAIKTDGTLWSWGNGTAGILGNGTTVSRSSPGTVWGSYTTWCQVSGGSLVTIAIKCDGTLWTWGNNSFGALGDGTTVSRCSPGTIFGGGTTWCQFSGGYRFGAAIKCDGTLWTWGCNTNGTLGDGTTVSRCSPGTIFGGGTTWCQVSVERNTAAIKTDGTLWTWGCNCCGVLGDGTTVSRSSPGTVAGGGTTWCQVSTDSSTTLVLKSRGF